MTQERPIFFSPEPPRIKSLLIKYESGDTLTPGEMISIVHLLPPANQVEYLTKYGEMMRTIWTEHMPGRFKIYEPIVENLTTYRRDIIRSLPLTSGDEVIDLGAGFCPLAKHLAEEVPGAAYIALDANPKAKEVSIPLLSSLWSSKKLFGAVFIEQDYLRGLPSLPDKDAGQKRIAVSSFSLAYCPANAMERVIKDSFNHGCDYFFLTALNPEHFDSDSMLDEMVKEASQKSPEEQSKLAPYVNLAQSAEGRGFMRTFVKILKENAPIRTFEETSYYLSLAGDIQKIVTFGPGTGKSFGFLISPKP